MIKCIGKECFHFVDCGKGVCNFDERVFADDVNPCCIIPEINDLEREYKLMDMLRTLILHRQEGEV